MKYLIRFDESEYPRRDLDAFCKNYLANMIDTHGTKIKVSNKLDHYEVEINTMGHNSRWGDLKNDFIPFFNMLLDNYELLPVDGLRYIDLTSQKFTKRAILNDKVDNRVPASFIKLKVKK